MTVCANCGTSQGPFTRVSGVGPLCAPTRPAPKGIKDPLIADCNGRRKKLDEAGS